MRVCIISNKNMTIFLTNDSFAAKVSFIVDQHKPV